MVTSKPPKPAGKRGKNAGKRSMGYKQPAMLYQKGTQRVKKLVHLIRSYAKIGEPNEGNLGEGIWRWSYNSQVFDFASLHIFITQIPKLPRKNNPNSPKDFKFMITWFQTNNLFTYKNILSDGTSITSDSTPEILLLPSVPSLGVAVAHDPCVVDSWHPLSIPPEVGLAS